MIYLETVSKKIIYALIIEIDAYFCEAYDNAIVKPLTKLFIDPMEKDIKGKKNVIVDYKISNKTCFDNHMFTHDYWLR